MAGKEIVWSPTAEECINSIVNFYDEAIGNTKYRGTLINRINNLVSHFKRKPLSGKINIR